MGSDEKISKHDEKIIKELLENSRSPLRDIGKRVKLSASSVRNRMARLENLKVIKRYTVDVDWRKMGYDIEVILLISSWMTASKEIHETLSQLEQVSKVYWTAGTANLVCVVRVRSMQELSAFITENLEKLRGIERVESLFIMPVPE
ncbi:MAG: Lrp/AsnC family transcriptional regulator [Candidatus Thorarchaeota archaeon]